MKNDSILFSLLSAAHFYASLILGWRIFDVAIYPYFYVEAGRASVLASTLPIYAANVLAFGTLVYVATRPLLYLVDHLLNVIFSAFKRGYGSLDLD